MSACMLLLQDAYRSQTASVLEFDLHHAEVTLDWHHAKQTLMLLQTFVICVQFQSPTLTVWGILCAVKSLHAVEFK